MSEKDPLWDTLLADLEQRRLLAFAAGGPERIERQHKAGRMTARERIDSLVDEGSFLEFGTFVLTPDDNGSSLPSTFICGLAEIDGRPVAVGAEDFTVQGGGTGVHLAKYKGGWGGFIEELALEYRIPLILLEHGVGGSIALQEAKGYPELLARSPVFPVFHLLNAVPVLTAVLGPTAGSSAARAVLAHFSVMTKDSGCLFAGGPPLVKQALGLHVDKYDLGGSDTHIRTSGLINNLVDDEEHAFSSIRRVLSYLPLNVWELPEHVPTDDPVDRDCEELLSIVSPNGRRPYNVHRLIETVVDADSFFEIAPDHAMSVRTGLARIDGFPIGVIGTDSRHMAGAMTVESSQKQSRFVEMCDAFHLPIVYFVDVPGFMIGPDAERSGTLRAGAAAVATIQNAEVPVYTVQVRRSFGLAGQATGSPNRRSLRLAWPSGIWGDLPLAGGVESAHRAEILAAEDPDARRAEIMARYEQQSSPWRTVEHFGVEEMIDPRQTRRYLARLLKVAYRTARPGPKVGPKVRG